LSRVIPFGKKTYIMGILNVTPDSFYKGSRINDVKMAVEKCLKFVKEGAEIIDIGGESTRPGSHGITVDEEIKRVIPILKELRRLTGVLISVDTYKADVARIVLEEGADIINDITGLRYSGEIAQIVSKYKAYLILMHMRGMPSNMQNRANYTNVVEEVSSELDLSIKKAINLGVEKDRIILDPGIGFAKKAFHNLLILKNLKKLKAKGYPILIGLSRKSFIGIYTGLPIEERLIPTIAANAISIFNGADIIRVHDVKEAYYTAKISDAIARF